MSDRQAIENLLLSEKVITQEQLKIVLEEQKRKNKPLEEIFVDLNFISEEKITQYLSKLYHIPYENIEEIFIDPQLVTEVPEEVARKHIIIPLKKENEIIFYGTFNPFNFGAQDEIQFATKCKCQPILCSRTGILKKLNELRDHYRVVSVEKLLKEFENAPEKLVLGKEPASELKIDDVAKQAPIIRMVNLIILQALHRRASDIHFQPDEKDLIIRYRIDGILEDVKSFPIDVLAAVVSRIKIMCEMDIAEKRLPQDGHFSLKINKREIDFRVSTVPTVCGEKIVIRILDRGSLLLGLDYLGFDEIILKNFKEVIKKTYGIIAITGPTGSGKTTTLYSALSSINSPEKNITTVENPVEYHLQGIAQIQVKSKIGLTFANVLRSILRQDPDIILVGEIRDLETTEIAIRSSLTGHLVFATLHTNDAASSITRLIDMGAEPFLVASSLKAILSQRLVRKICSNCREEYKMETKLLTQYGFNSNEEFITLYRGRGCKLCFHTGYQGRIATGELLIINDEIRNLIVSKSTSTDIKESARKNGMQTLREDGVNKVLQGKTTLEEILRVSEED